MITISLMSSQPVAGLVERALEVAPSSRGRACRCRRARSRRRPAAPTRCMRDARAGRAAAAAARCRAARARRGRPRAVGSACARPAHATVPAMAKKGRRREASARRRASTATSTARVLVLRGALTPATRAQYAEVAAATSSPARTRGSARSSSCSSGSPCAGRSRAPSRSRARRSCSRASASPRPRSARWIRDMLRAHLAEHFPDMEAPYERRRLRAAC